MAEVQYDISNDFECIDLEIWRQKVQEEMDKDPLLCHDGIGLGSNTIKYTKDELASRRNKFLSDQTAMAVRHCCLILAHVSKTKTINYQGANSYGLKHVVERITTPAFRLNYISNGEFITAARIAGFKDDGRFNCDFNMSKKSWNAISKARGNKHIVSFYDEIVPKL